MKQPYVWVVEILNFRLAIWMPHACLATGTRTRMREVMAQLVRNNPRNKFRLVKYVREHE